MSVDFTSSSNSPDSEKVILADFGTGNKYAICYPEDESPQSYLVTNQVNLMAHVFCRQLGHMTYTSRHPVNGMTEVTSKAIWPSVLCNGTEQRLVDCHWPEVKSVACNQFLEVKCGSCSKYFSHVDDGVITTPGFPVSFPYTIQCDWLIYTKLGDGIELRFTAFNLPTQLPFSQIGSSTCVTSNAFLDITPNDDTDKSGVERLVSNSNRYCVYKAPDRKVRIKSKAVWIHFLSGIHSSLFSSFRSHSLVKRPIGIKIYFRAFQASPETQGVFNTYLIAGLTALCIVVITVAVVVIIWAKTRHRKKKRGTDSSESEPKNCGAICRRRRTDSDATNNYEEIRVQTRPQVPPRSFGAQVPDSVTRPSAHSMRSNDSSIYRLEKFQTHLQRQLDRSFEVKTPPPTPGSFTGQYMQVVCSSSGHCQYVPCNEIQCHRQVVRNSSLKSQASLGSHASHGSCKRSESTV
jgi:hypothetical protein